MVFIDQSPFTPLSIYLPEFHYFYFFILKVIWKVNDLTCTHIKLVMNLQGTWELSHIIKQSKILSKEHLINLCRKKKQIDFIILPPIIHHSCHFYDYTYCYLFLRSWKFFLHSVLSAFKMQDENIINETFSHWK